MGSLVSTNSQGGYTLERHNELINHAHLTCNERTKISLSLIRELDGIPTSSTKSEGEGVHNLHHLFSQVHPKNNELNFTSNTLGNCLVIELKGFVSENPYTRINNLPKIELVAKITLSKEEATLSAIWSHETPLTQTDNGFFPVSQMEPKCERYSSPFTEELPLVSCPYGAS